MIKLLLSFARWINLKNDLDFSEFNIKTSYIGVATLRLKGCIDIFNLICRKGVSHILKASLEWSIYA